MTEIILIVFDVIVHDQNLLIIFCLRRLPSANSSAA